jgi:hypothetical protein
VFNARPIMLENADSTKCFSAVASRLDYIENVLSLNACHDICVNDVKCIFGMYKPDTPTLLCSTYKDGCKDFSA